MPSEWLTAWRAPLGWWGVIGAAGIAWAAYRARSLSRSGAQMAWLEGSVILGLGGWAWGVLLLAFFVSSSALSRVARARKRSVAEKFSKGSRRDASQVLANGGLAALLALTARLSPTDSAAVWVAFAAALATATADTWATEVGVLHPRPRHVLTGRPVPPGTSGGVSPLGWLAAALGAGLLAALAAWLAPSDASRVPVALAVVCGGLMGSGVDSLLGATIQAMYYCPRCAKETEQHPRHRCGTPTRFVRGWRWMDNDMVNALAIAAGAAVAVLVWAWIGG